MSIVNYILPLLVFLCFTCQPITAQKAQECNLKVFLSLKNKTLQADFFRKIDSVTAAQYPEGKAPTINITPAILNKYLSDIEKDLSQQCKKQNLYKLLPKRLCFHPASAVLLLFKRTRCSSRIIGNLLLYNHRWKDCKFWERRKLNYQ